MIYHPSVMNVCYFLTPFWSLELQFLSWMVITVSHYIISLANVITLQQLRHVRKETQFSELLTTTETQFTVRI